jgi:hypothetical protein
MCICMVSMVLMELPIIFRYFVTTYAYLHVPEIYIYLNHEWNELHTQFAIKYENIRKRESFVIIVFSLGILRYIIL